MVRVFVPSSTNEVRLTNQIDAHIGKAVELGLPLARRRTPSRCTR